MTEAAVCGRAVVGRDWPVHGRLWEVAGRDSECAVQERPVVALDTGLVDDGRVVGVDMMKGSWSATAVLPSSDAVGTK